MKKWVCVVLLLFSMIAGCQKDLFENAEISYGESSLYTNEEMDEAMDLIKAEIGSWGGFELLNIRYVSDSFCNEENIRWLNELAQRQNTSTEFTQCIYFETDFRAPINAEAPWNAGTMYVDYGWYLARSDQGDWKLIPGAYGYG